MQCDRLPFGSDGVEMRMARVKQLSFLGVGLEKPRASFGGDLLKNSNAKIKRPLDSKLPLHLVLLLKEVVLYLQ